MFIKSLVDFITALLGTHLLSPSFEIRDISFLFLRFKVASTRIGLFDSINMYLIFKRFFDIVFSVIGLFTASPVLLFSIIVIKLETEGPIFFSQDRLGKNGRVFTLYKFRTMINKKREVNREILKEDVEVTKIGYYLRRLKIDELPQLINVLKGDMSLVGPRPCMPELKDSFNEDGKFRIRVLPGLTGLAQVNGNIYLSWPQRWKYDREYVENISFLYDVSIILKTFDILLCGEEKFKKDE